MYFDFFQIHKKNNLQTLTLWLLTTDVYKKLQLLDVDN